MKGLRPILGIAIILLGVHLVQRYLQEPSYEEFHGASTTFSSEQRALFVAFLKQERIPYLTESTGYLYYHLSGHAKVRAFERKIHGSTDYGSVLPMDSEMEALLRKEFEQAGIPYTVRMVGNPSTLNFTYEAKYNSQVDLISQSAWLDRAERLKRDNDSLRLFK